MQNLFGKTFLQIQAIVTDSGLPSFTARQICEWLYKKHADRFEDMTNLSKRARQQLADSFTLDIAAPSSVQTSADGTKKYLFAAGCNRFIESAYIPDRSRATLCVSAQVGCKMGCLFCLTGKQGFQAQLPAGDIINQVRSLPERDSLTNIVYMGMGEPFDNLDNVMDSLEILTADWGYAMSPRRITVSTIGILPAMQHFIEHSQCHLAVSLHSPFHEERAKLMPVETVYPAEKILALLRAYDFGRQRRISFEYILFKDLNDTPRHSAALSRMLNGLRCRVNLIRFHPIPGSPLACSPEPTINTFRDALMQKGIRTTIRASRGQDISAACGMLSTKERVKVQAPDF